MISKNTTSISDMDCDWLQGRFVNESIVFETNNYW